MGGMCVAPTMSPSDCMWGETGCMTEYGVDENTICYWDEMGMSYCVEQCTPSDSTCDPEETCYPQPDGTGVCFYMWY